MNYKSHLSKDKKLAAIIEGQKTFRLDNRENVFLSLCGSIISQQLSVKVAAVIYKRFLDLYKTENPDPAEVEATPLEVLRGIGLSNAKANYVKNVAQFAISPGMDRNILNLKTDEELIEYLTAIKGVGRWTVEMLLMFTLGREDVFAVDDLGFQNAMIRLYKLKRDDKKKFRNDLLRISNRWKPYRTYACLHLWHWKDNVPAVKS